MIKIVVDVGLPPAWIPVLTAEGWEAVHWSTVGDLRAPDRTIMEWARQQSQVVFTHDLDSQTVAQTARAPREGLLGEHLC